MIAVKSRSREENKIDDESRTHLVIEVIIV